MVELKKMVDQSKTGALMDHSACLNNRNSESENSVSIHKKEVSASTVPCTGSAPETSGNNKAEGDSSASSLAGS